MELGLTQKVVVITGGATGIGLSTALTFAAEGARVAICSRTADKLNSAAALFADRGYELFTRVVDVSLEDELQAFANQVYDHFGQLGVWINNAGISPKARLIDMTGAGWDNLMHTNLRAVFLGSQFAAKLMRKHGGGVILNAASYAAVMPSATSGAYAAAKSGVVSLTRSLAAELAPLGIRVVAYIPGIIATEINKKRMEQFGTQMLSQISLQRWGKTEEVANVLVFLASEKAGYITGTAIEITGGKFSIQNPEFPWTW